MFDKKQWTREYWKKNHSKLLQTERTYRRKTANASTKRYEKTPKGFLMRTYRNMKSRVTGIQKLKAHLYKGKTLLAREEFYQWAMEDSSFWLLYWAWKSSGYNRKLTPSINRIDPQGGYTIDNMEWLTHSENSRLSNRTR